MLYDQWVLRLLGLTSLPPVPWSELTRGTDDRYRVAALPSPAALESWLLTQNPGVGDSARIAAGYCWRSRTYAAEPSYSALTRPASPAGVVG